MSLKSSELLWKNEEKRSLLKKSRQAVVYLEKEDNGGDCPSKQYDGSKKY